MLFLLDNARGCIGSGGIHFLFRAVREVSPTVHNIYLLRRLRRQAAAIERARIARDLHDGVVQSLFGIEMRLHLLRKSVNDEYASQQLSEIKDLVHDQLLNLRELVQEVRALEVAPARLVDFLSETVEKFGRETGIAAHFEAEPQSIELPPRHCREIARIVHESLVNVRKHSGARAVMVRLSDAEGEVTLAVEDDGAGFDFTGDMNLNELDRNHKGPVVIKERVRSLRGALNIESFPWRGSRLVVTLPKEPYAAQAGSGA
jgi:signal transduction histidine kinase